jgi:invasion protein IalB
MNGGGIKGLGLSLAALALAGAAQAETVTFQKKSGDWSLYVNANKSFCFISAAPSKSEPAGAKRGPAQLYISAWPKDGSKSEVSARLGYPAKASAKFTATAGEATFKLFAKDEIGFIAEAAEEQKLIEAMKNAPSIVVQATSERGTATSDTYPLNGFAEALQNLTTTCP